MAEASAVKYRAFLSYSHRDKAWGKWLHGALEGYRIDKDLVGRETPVGPVPKTLRPIFRDREDFSAGHSLTAQTLAALEASQFLIVLCSPNAAQSKYVNEEIRRFKVMGRGDRVMPVIVDGEPGNLARECFPPALRFKVGADGQITDEPEEPIAADARAHGDGKEIAKQKVVAGLLGLGLDEIVRRAQRARRRRNRFWEALAGVFLVLAITATGSAIYASQQLKTNEAFLNATLRRATEIVNTAVSQAVKYNVPRTATLELLHQAEGLFDDMARLGRPTPELQYRKALMLIEFARNYSLLGKSDLQQARAEASLQLCEGLTRQQPNNPDWQLALSHAFIELGDALRIRGQLDAALPQYEVSLFIAKRFGIGAMTNKFLLIKSMSYERIGDVLKAQGRFAEAASYYRSNLELNQNNPAAHERMGTVALDMGNKDVALEHYRKMLAINKQRSDAEPNNSEFQRDLAVSHNDVGKVLLAQGKLPEALENFRADLAIGERLSGTDRSRAGWQVDAAIAHRMVGDVLIAQGNIQEARSSYKRTISIIEPLARGDPRNWFWRFGEANAHAAIADTYIAEGRLDDALASYRTSHAIWEQVAAIQPSNVQLQINLLWSHSRLTLFGDEPLRRWELIVSTLKNLQKDHKLTAELERWVPVAEEGLAAVNPANKYWQWDLLNMYWRAAHLTENPIRHASVVVAMLRKLKDENKLTAEQAKWLPAAEAQVASMQTQ